MPSLSQPPLDPDMKAQPVAYAFPLTPCRPHTFQWEDGEHDECYRCGAPKPRPSADGAPKEWIYHDVPAAEVRTAKSTGTHVTPPCGWTFTPMTPPTRPTPAGPQATVKLRRCSVCREITQAGGMA